MSVQMRADDVPIGRDSPKRGFRWFLARILLPKIGEVTRRRRAHISGEGNYIAIKYMTRCWQCQGIYYFLLHRGRSNICWWMSFMQWHLWAKLNGVSWRSMAKIHENHQLPRVVPGENKLSTRYQRTAEGCEEGKQVTNGLPRDYQNRLRWEKTIFRTATSKTTASEQSGWRTCKQATHKTRGWNQYNQRKREFSFFFFFFWHHVLFRLFFFLLVTVSSTLLTAYEAPEPATAAPSALPPATSAGTRAAKGSTPPFCQRRRLLDLFSSWFTRRLNLTRFMMVRRMDMAQIQWVQVFLYDLGSCRR